MLGTFVGGSTFVEGGATKHSFDLVDLDRDELVRIPVDFLPHGFTTKPGAPHLAVVFEKRGPGAALLDLAARRAVGKIRARSDRAYYGHGLFTGDGAHLLSVEIDLATRAGLLSVRETATFKEVDVFPTHGDSPHDCVAIDGGKTLVITNGGGEVGGADPCVTYVDVASRKLLEKVTFSDPKINAGHVAISADGTLAIVSAPRDGLPRETSAGGISARTPRRRAERMRGPDAVMAQVVGESLSVKIHEPTGIVGVTNPSGGIVTFWDLRARKFLAAHRCEAPRGIELTRDGTAFVITHGRQGAITLVAVDRLRPIERAFGEFRLSGSHIYPLA